MTTPESLNMLREWWGFQTIPDRARIIRNTIIYTALLILLLVLTTCAGILAVNYTIAQISV